MSPMYTEAATLEAVSLSQAGEEIRSTAWKPLVQFWSVMAMICLFLGYGAWVLYGIGSHGGPLERPVSLALLGFYVTSLPGCAYFAWREYRKLNKHSQ